MSRWILGRLVQSLPLLLGITAAVFVALHAMPGGPMAAYESNPEITAEDLARLRSQLGLDEPVPVQYARWLGHVLSGDWGWSFVTRRPVLDMIGERVDRTLLLMGLAFALALAVAVPVGIISATRPYSAFDHAATTFSFVGFSMPTFWSGLLAILVFSVWLRWLPAGGMFTLGADFSIGDRVRHLVLPVSTLALYYAGRYARYIRSGMLEVLGQEYIRTARAKGLAARAVVGRHALKNALIPVVTVFALDLPGMFSGALITETMFSWPGMGRLFWEATARMDYPVLMGTITITAGLVVLLNLVTDAVYGWLDPRIRYG